MNNTLVCLNVNLFAHFIKAIVIEGINVRRNMFLKHMKIRIV